MRRLSIVLAVLVLTALVWALLRDRVVVVDLGEAVAVHGFDGAPCALIERAAGRLAVVGAQTGDAADVTELDVRVRGRPHVDAAGAVVALAQPGLVAWPGPRPAGAPTVRVAAEALPPQARLEGLFDDGAALLSAPDGGARTFLVAADGVPAPVATPEGDLARAPPDARIAVSPVERRFAFATEGGWEIWTCGEVPVVRRVPLDDVAPVALFRPDGEALIVEKEGDALWYVFVEDGRLVFMAEGNLGVSRRVGCSFVFRRYRDEPEKLFAPQWHHDGNLVLMQTHLGGGGRRMFKPSGLHTYELHGSPDGRFAAYVQARFDEDTDAPFDEDIYRFDFENPADTLHLGRRAGAASVERGPWFVGDGAHVLFVADGRACLAYDAARSP